MSKTALKPKTLQDTGRSVATNWKSGSEYHARYLGEFNPTMDAATAWQRLDFEGKVNASSFPLFKKGWDSVMFPAQSKSAR